MTNFRTIRHLRWVLAIALCTLCYAVVCREHSVRGFEESAARAVRLLPPNTSDTRKAAIYVEKTQRGLYFHSNFVSPGAENPTKIAGERLTDLREAFLNLMFWGEEAF